MIERKDARTALITTGGFRDSLEIAYESRYDQCDIAIQKPEPLIPRYLRFSVAERVDIKDRVLRELDTESVLKLVPALQQHDFEAIAIGFIHSYANPQHEQATAALLREAGIDAEITLSCEVCPEVREYERFMTTACNAYVQTLMRTAFNPIVRESGDLSAGLFDIRGRMISQAVTGTPGHVNTKAESVSHFLAYYDLDDLHPDDIYLINDPWKAAGHLNDFMLVRPWFHRDRLVGFTSCTSHLTDIGGLGYGPDASDVLDEGLFVPIIKLVEAGILNQTFMSILKANTRVPVEVEGDIYALIACAECGSNRLTQCLDDFDLAAAVSDD